MKKLQKLSTTATTVHNKFYWFLHPFLGLNKDLALRLIKFFGAGIVYMQQPRGLVSGASMHTGMFLVVKTLI